MPAEGGGGGGGEMGFRTGPLFCATTDVGAKGAGTQVFGQNSFFHQPPPLHISLGDIHNLPTLWVLALFGNFYNFCSDVQTCCHLGGGYVYTF